MLARFRSVIAFGLLSLALAIGVPAHAASLGGGSDFPAYFIANVTINGGTEALSGVLGSSPPSDDWQVNITNNSDAKTTFTIADPNPNPGPDGFLNYQLFECTLGAGNCDAADGDVYNAVGVSQTGTFTTILLATSEYFVRIGGATTTGGYRVNVSAVPLPAAAWLFMSALAGFGVLSRRKKQL